MTFEYRVMVTAFAILAMFDIRDIFEILENFNISKFLGLKYLHISMFWDLKNRVNNVLENDQQSDLEL